MNLTGGGNPYAHLERETEDRVFLLSFTELCAYFSEDPYPGCYGEPYGYDELLCYPTEYAKTAVANDVSDKNLWMVVM